MTPEGLPLAYEVLPGNTADKTTLRPFLEHIERQYGKARRVWLMDRGVPSEEVLAEMPAADPPVHYLVGTPKGRLTRLERHLIAKPWHEARPGVQVKLLAQEGELYVLAQSRDRVAKERAIRRRQLKRLWARLKQLSTMQISREELLMKLGGARDQSRIAWRLAVIEIDGDSATFSYRLDRNKRRQARSRKAGICCAPTSSRKTRPSCGATTCCWWRSRRRSRIAKATLPSGRSFTSSRPVSRRTSSTNIRNSLACHIFPRRWCGCEKSAAFVSVLDGDGHWVEYNDPVFGERMPEATAGGPVRRESHHGRDDAP